jgi:hypothetical protein
VTGEALYRVKISADGRLPLYLIGHAASHHDDVIGVARSFR